MFSIQQFIESPTDIELLRQHIQESKISFFSEVLDEAIFAMFQEPEIDSAFLEDLAIHFDDVVQGTHYPIFPSVEDELTGFKPRNSPRTVDRLISKTQAAIDAPYLGFHALQLCLGAYNTWVEDGRDGQYLSKMINIFGEASESVALARISSSHLEFLFDRDITTREREDSRQNSKIEIEVRDSRISQTQTNNANIGVVKTRKRMNRTLTIMEPYIKNIWRKEPQIPYGVLGDAVHDWVNRNSIDTKIYYKLGRESILSFLKETAPDTAIYRTRPSLKNGAGKLRKKSNDALASELVNKEFPEDLFNSANS